MNKWVILAVASTVLASSPALAAEITVLSGGAIEPGLLAAAQAYRKESGNEVKVKFATAPVIRREVAAGAATADIVIAPPAVIDELVKAAKLDGQARVGVGKVGVGVAVRNGAPKPDIANTEAFKRAVLEAESLVYNTASSGIYVEKLLERLGVGEQVKAKTKRYPTGAAVMEHLVKGSGKEVGIGPITEIKLYTEKGAVFVGPLPADIQNYTSYDAALSAAPANRDGAASLLKYLGSPAAKALFVAKGID